MDTATQSKQPPFTLIALQAHFVLGPEHVHAASDADIVTVSNRNLSSCRAANRNLQKRFDLSAMRVDGHPARRRHKNQLGNPPSRADIIFSTARLNEITEHAADLTVSVGAGCTIQTLQKLSPSTASVWRSIHFGRRKPP